MSDRTKALGILVLIVAVTFEVAWLLTPWADAVALVLMLGIALASNAFAGVYMLTRPWWSTAIGKAMLVSSLSLALLVDISLLYQWLGDDYSARDAVRLTVFALIFGGASFKCYALFAPSWLRPRQRGTRDRSLRG